MPYHLFCHSNGVALPDYEIKVLCLCNVKCVWSHYGSKLVSTFNLIKFSSAPIYQMAVDLTQVCKMNFGISALSLSE